MSDVLIKADGVGKKFCRNLKKSLWYATKDSVADLLRLPTEHRTDRLRKDEFWANRDITFEVKRGECLGLIGGNGAGKTTLLKMLSGLIKPDQGEIQIRGQVGALIALGAGFNPVLTGRENIFVYGSVLGMTRSEVAAKLDEIMDFAEIPDAIDSPVRTYSSGMTVRLGFATAVHLMKPDILLLDEVLAVGDLGFRRKCYAVVNDLLQNAAVIFVSHSMEHVNRICNSALLMESGTGKPCSTEEAIRTYHRNSQQTTFSHHQGKTYPPVKSIEVDDLPNGLNSGENLTLGITLELEKDVAESELVVSITNCNDIPIATWNSRLSNSPFVLTAGTNRISVTLHDMYLSPSEYKITLNLVMAKSILCMVSEYSVGKVKIHSSNAIEGDGYYQLNNATITVSNKRKSS